jgi:GT2 family glycosyltransferase
MNPRFSVVVCSADRARQLECTEAYNRAFAAETFELIRIDNPPSLAAGYNRGLESAHGEFVVFTHDDAWPISDGAADRLAAHLADCDVVGIAGATLAMNGFWGFCGQPHTHGHVVTPASGSTWVDVLIWGAEAPRILGAKLLDGCFIAARRRVAADLGFDAATFDGFHLYDADFSLRANAAGLAVAVVADVTVFHRSVGEFGAEWQRYNEKFLVRHRRLLDNAEPRPRRCARIGFRNATNAVQGVNAERIASLTPQLRER